MGNAFTSKERDVEAHTPIATARVACTEPSGKESTPQAKVIGTVDPDSEIQRVLHVGKDWTWSRIEEIITTLVEPVEVRYRALTLAFKKSPSPSELVRVMERALAIQTGSLLLRHEICYMIGQAGNDKALEILRHILFDENEDEVVRHEAAEALWAVTCLSDGAVEALSDIKKFVDHKSTPLAQTCQLVVLGVEHELDDDEDEESGESSKLKTSEPPLICACQSKTSGGKSSTSTAYTTRDPATAISDASRSMIPSLGRTLRDESQSLLTRYRAMFTLRNLGGDKAVRELCKALEMDKSSEIMRHEIAFVLGQMASTCDRSELAIPTLVAMLERKNEHGMVRHEAALAIGCLGTWSRASFRKARGILRKFSKDPDPLVAESCVCALDDLLAPIDWVGKDGW